MGYKEGRWAISRGAGVMSSKSSAGVCMDMHAHAILHGKTNRTNRWASHHQMTVRSICGMVCKETLPYLGSMASYSSPSKVALPVLFDAAANKPAVALAATGTAMMPGAGPGDASLLGFVDQGQAIWRTVLLLRPSSPGAGSADASALHPGVVLAAPCG
jgi:hypothetical protein